MANHVTAKQFQSKDKRLLAASRDVVLTLIDPVWNSIEDVFLLVGGDLNSWRRSL